MNIFFSTFVFLFTTAVFCSNQIKPELDFVLSTSFPQEFGLRPYYPNHETRIVPFIKLSRVKTREEISVMVKLVNMETLSKLKDMGFQPRGIFYRNGEVVTGIRIEPYRLSELYNLTGVSAISLSSCFQKTSLPHTEKKFYKVLLNDIHDETGVRDFHNNGYKGEGVIIGMFDTGIQWNNPDFWNSDSSSRILFLWDQSLKPKAGEASPRYPGTEFGVEYSKAQLDAEIKGKISGFIRHKGDKTEHGTYTTSAAASSGLKANSVTPAGIFVGAAPKAHIIFISGEDTLGQFPEENIIAALDYFTAKADSMGLPIVMNFSISDKITARDGSSLSEEKINELTGEGKRGRLVVVSSGNDGNGYTHQTKDFNRFERNFDFEFTIPGYDTNPGFYNDIQGFYFLYEGSDNIALDIAGPVTSSTNPSYIFTADYTDSIKSFASRECGLIQVAKTLDTAGGLQYILVYIFDDTLNGVNYVPKKGAWRFTFKRQQFRAAGRMQCWALNMLICGSRAIYAEIKNGDDFMTVTSPGTGTSSLSVGYYINKTRYVNMNGDSMHFVRDTLFNCKDLGKSDVDGSLDFNSSRGPARDGRIKPEIIGPGMRVLVTKPTDINISPKNWEIYKDSIHVGAGGSSISSPIVAGAAALLLQMKPGLDGAEIKDMFRVMAKSDDFTGQTPNNTWGWGKIYLDYKYASNLYVNGKENFRWNSNMDMILRPNPAVNYLDIVLKIRFNYLNPIQVQLYNSSGKKVHLESMYPQLNKTDNFKLNLHDPIKDLPSGLYLVRVQLSESRTLQRKIVIMH
ncbi:MAG: S8 family serine peptidase [bacterium]